MTSVPEDRIDEWLALHPEVEVSVHEHSTGRSLEWVSTIMGFNWTLREGLTSDLSIFVQGRLWTGFFPANEWIFGEVLGLMDLVLEGDESKVVAGVKRLSLSRATT